MTVSMLCLILMMSSFASAATSSKNLDKNKFDIVTAKNNLAFKHRDKAINMTEKERVARAESIESFVMQLFIEGLTNEQISKELEKKGVYKLEIPESVIDEVTPMSQSADYTLNRPTIFYDTLAKNWIVEGTGSWSNSNWATDIDKVFWDRKGEIYNIGFNDAVGISYYNTNNYEASVLSSHALILSDKGNANGGSWDLLIRNPSDGDGSKGVAFEFQDQVQLLNLKLKITEADLSYLGHRFQVMIVYNDKFKDYSGNARTFYAHTWKEAYISSISFNLSSSPGVTINLSSQTQAFKIFSDRDTPF